jgi:ABC-type bacteriocin/lantibiotic exporter with double-glycine peptidase domain
VVHAPHLRLLGRLPQERRRLTERADRVRRVAVSRQKHTSLLRVIPDVAQALAATGILWIALSNGLPTGDAAAALAALALMTQPIRELASVWDRYAAWRHARERCEQLLSVPRLSSRGRLEKRSSPEQRESVPVRLREVSYGPLQSIDARIKPGRKIGITGPNGGGKSLLLRLVAGLLAPDQGTVRVDRIEPAGASGRSRRDLLSYSGANAPVLSGTLRRALTLGAKRRPDDRAIESAAKHFGLAAVLNRLGGLDGRVAENGRNLSTGECRRILLARTLLADAPLWLLDEPDDALDQAGRQALGQALAQTASTVMVVSHDWSTLSLCDEVWFMEDGCLVESGDPRDLLQHDGPIARFFAFDLVG